MKRDFAGKTALAMTLFAAFAAMAADDAVWTGAAGDCDWLNAANWSAGAVPAAADTVTVDVGAGSAAVVISNVCANTTIRKTGAGLLKLNYNSISNAANSKLELVEGRVEFPRVVLPPELLAKAGFWVNPALPETLHVHSEGGTNFVWRIDDVRGNGMFAYATDSAERDSWSGAVWGWDRHTARTPYLVDDPQMASAPYLEFGTIAYTNDLERGWGGAMRWSARLDNARTIVMAALHNQEVQIPFETGHIYQAIVGDTVGSRNWQPSSKGALVDPSLSQQQKQTAIWENGAYLHNNASGYFLGAAAPMAVVALQKELENAPCDTFGYWNSTYSAIIKRSGGIRIGETLVFTQELSAAEIELASLAVAQNYRRDLVAHIGGAAEYSVGADGAVVVEVARSETLRRAGAAGAQVRKYGEGSFLIEEAIMPGQTFEVHAGRLSVHGWPASLHFHLDPNKPATLTLREENGKTLVEEIRDTRFNGKSASNKGLVNYDKNMREPMLVEDASSGAVRKVLDLGGRVYRTTGEEGGWGGFLRFSNDAAIARNLRTMFMVFADNHTTELLKYSAIFGETHLPNSDSREWERNLRDGLLYNQSLGSGANRVRFHNFQIDDGEMTLGTNMKSSIADENFHNISFIADEANEATYGVPSAQCIGLQWGNPAGTAGGGRYGEIALFTNRLDEAWYGRIRSYMGVKWFGKESALEAGQGCSFGNLKVARGAALDVGLSPLNQLPATARAAGGGGELEVYRLTVSEELRLGDEGAVGTLSVKGDLAIGEGAAVKVGCTGPAALGALAVDGALALPENATLQVDSFGGAALAYGEYDLFRAESIVNAGAVRKWRCGGTLRKTRQFALVPGADGKSVRLRVMPGGMLIIVR